MKTRLTRDVTEKLRPGMLIGYYGHKMEIRSIKYLYGIEAALELCAAGTGDKTVNWSPSVDHPNLWVPEETLAIIEEKAIYNACAKPCPTQSRCSSL